MRSPMLGYVTLLQRNGALPFLPRAACFSLTLGLAASCSIVRAPVLSHWLLCSLAWSFVPMIQLCSGSVVMALLGRRRDARPLLGLHFAGNGPHLVAALCAAAWSIAPVDGTSLRYLPIIGVGLGALVYGAIIHTAFYRVVFGRSRGKAVLWVAGEWAIRVALIVVWFALMNNLAPQILGRRS